MLCIYRRHTADMYSNEHFKIKIYIQQISRQRSRKISIRILCTIVSSSFSLTLSLFFSLDGKSRHNRRNTQKTNLLLAGAVLYMHNILLYIIIMMYYI